MVFLRIFVLGFLCLLSVKAATDHGPLNALGQALAFSSLLFVPAMYMLPTYEAWSREHPNLVPIALVNVFLGWTLVGWVAAIVWALKRSESQQQLPVAPIVQSASPGAISVADELQKLATLREKGLLSDDEFATQKSLLLSRSSR
jgi:hypothetical protein